MGELGLHGVAVPSSDGGLGLGYGTQCRVMEILSRACPSVGLGYGAHSNLCMDQIVRRGSRAQKARWLPRLLSGDDIGALAMTETEAGSDVLSMRTSATRVGDHYVLRGGKMFITNAGPAARYVVYARTASSAPRGRQLSCFVVDARTPGLTWGTQISKFGMRGSHTRSLAFDGCRVPAQDRLGREGDGTDILLAGLNTERLVLAAGPLGIMAACLDIVLPYIAARRQFGRPLAKQQMIQGKVADMQTALSASRELVYAAARAADAGVVAPETSAAAILFAAEMATRTALDAVQCMGGYGYTTDYGVAKLVADAKLYEIGAGTSEMRRKTIAGQIMKKVPKQD